MDTRYLQSFVAICDHGSFAEAARYLNLTPAALAARIRTLEEEIGTSLLTRAGRVARPTEAGVRIMDRVRAMLKDARSIQAIANNDEQLGELRLGVATSTLAELTPQLLKRLYRLHPTLRIYVESGASTYLYNRVVSRDIDAAIMAEPVHASPKGFKWMLLKEERLVLIAPPSMKGADPDHLLATQPFLRFDRTLRGGQAVETYLRRHGIRPQERLEIDTLVTIAYLVRDGVGISLVPDWSPGWLESLGLARMVLPEAAPMRRMGVFWDANGVSAGMVKTLLEETRHLPV
ncbi:LysR family transcriptional regulator [Bordetella genomosp. 10]|uniref:LysR family transcriptional regulator n=1 Tax=Bordetella genomosp. 10 TaxID=1416804 RepID=A0A261SBJ6_9BORD|nr:LysR family transcriptional regulator [Bordetella genomosp. 10]OZI34332.1 LysR family transcriptional regulator [Bordetella genomosp. 10]